VHHRSTRSLNTGGIEHRDCTWLERVDGRLVPRTKDERQYAGFD
jgi:hypothetical protein